MPNVSAGVAGSYLILPEFVKRQITPPWGEPASRCTINRGPQASLHTHLLTCQAQQLPSFLSPEIMTLGLLWLGLHLLGALPVQAQGSTPNLIPAPPLSRVPLQPNFQDDQVCEGLGGSAVGRAPARVRAEGRRGEESQEAH